MRNVYFHVDSDIVLRIRHLRGTMRSLRGAGGTVVFDDKESFAFQLAWAEVGLSAPDLERLLNRHVFGYAGAPLTRLRVRFEDGLVVQSGRLRKGLSLPFEIHARASVTPEGLIRLQPRRVEIFGLSTRRLMNAFGLSLDKLVDLGGARGAKVDGNDILLDPSRVVPPPAVEGRLTSIRVEDDEIVQVFGSREQADKIGPITPPDTRAPNYMFYRGGTLRFGKLLMLDADLQIVDMDPSDPFKFYLDQYLDQLVAGYSRTLSDQGLEVFMRDIDKIRKR
jgi:hypothetical protein